MPQRVLLFLSALSLVVFWVLLLTEWASRPVLLALLLAGMPSVVEPTYSKWRARRAKS